MKTTKTSDYSEEIVAVHNEFKEAEDKILRETMDIIKNTKLNYEKPIRLFQLGFEEVPEVKKHKKEEERLTEAEQTQDYILKYRKKYPLWKFITEKEINKICKKYGLYFGEVSIYRGFVPERNLKEIEQFKIDMNDAIGIYEQLDVSRWGTMLVELYSQTQTQTEEKKQKKELVLMKDHLKICAPLKDFVLKGTKIKGREIIKPVPDPVVLYAVNGGYLIITSWGTEASDPLILNEINN